MKPNILLVDPDSVHRMDERWNFCIADHIIEKDAGIATAVHYHSFYEVEIIYDGKAGHFLNQTEYEAKRGDVYLLRYFDAHRYENDHRNPLKIYNLIFNGIALPPELMDLFANSPQNLHCHFEEAEFSLLLADVRELLERQADTSSDPIHIHAMRMLFLKIMLAILKKIAARPNRNGTKNEIPLQHALRLIQCNFREVIVLKDIARQVGVTPNYLGQLFLQNLGMTFSAYLKNIRLEYAKNLLRFYDYSIEQIAALSGFATASHFISCFKSAYGMTPRQFQKKGYMIAFPLEIF